MSIPEPAVRLHELGKSFGRGGTFATVLNGCSFTMELGELVMLAGPSGCGKTTLLSILAATLRPDAGEVHVLGQRVDRLAAAPLSAFRTQRIGFVFQQFHLIAALTAPRDGTVLQSNIRVGEYASLEPAKPILVRGDIESLQVRADFDEQLAARIVPGTSAIGFVKGAGGQAIPLCFVRIEPYVIPKQSLTGSSTERVDTRVLQVIFRTGSVAAHPLYVGQQMDVYVDE